jgi:hypothetical protein
MLRGKSTVAVEAEKKDIVCLRKARLTVGVFGFCVAVAILVYVSIIWATANSNTVTVTPIECPEDSSIGVEDADACAVVESTDGCIAGFYSSNLLTCQYLPRPTSTNCTSACYMNGTNSTFCDAAGHCVGEAADCRGSCEDSAECIDEAFNGALNVDLINAFDAETGWTWIWYNPYFCFFGRCTLSTLDMFAVTSEETWNQAPHQGYSFLPLAARFECTDYLDPDFVEERGHCIRSVRYLIDPNLTDYLLFSFTERYGNTSFPFQLSVCIFYYTCSQIDGSLLASVGAAATAADLKTSRAHGFARVGGNTDVTDEQAAFSMSPAMRSQFWNQLYDVTSTTLADTPPDVLSALLNWPIS